MRKKISIDQLKPGMYVVATDRGWLEVPFFRRRIRDQEVVERIRKSTVSELIIDTSKGLDVDEARAFLPNPGQKAIETLFQASEVHAQVMAKTSALLDDVRRGQPLSDAASQEQISSLLEQIIEDPQSMLCVSVLRKVDDFTYGHCVNMTVMALLIGREMKLTKEELVNLGKGALLHDIGKCMIPREILTKTSKLSSNEMAIMKSHVEKGVSYLRKMKSFPEPVIEFAADHHERLDGSGYPRGLKGAEISWYGRLAAVMDVYDSMIHRHYYKNSADPHAILDELDQQAGTIFDAEAVSLLKRCLGPYPPGTMLMLSTGEMALSYEPNFTNIEQPKVLMLIREDGVFYAEPILLDLAKQGGDAMKTILTTLTPTDTNFYPLEILFKQHARENPH